MEKSYYSLEIRDNNRLTRFFQAFFGIICIAIAVYWLFQNPESLKSDWTLWITIIFLTGFGSFQIASGFGYSERFIDISTEGIILKSNSILPSVNMVTASIEKIEVFPLKVIFKRKGKHNILFRLGVTEYEKAEKIKDSIIIFCGETGTGLEIKNEE